jgi:putative transposase
MSSYTRPRVAGARIFFTVALADRGSDLLVAEIGRLRDAVRATRAERPFGIDAFVVLPDHLHAVWSLPDDDDYPTRWRLIKPRFSMGLPKGPLRRSHLARQERGIWQRRYWEHHLRGGRDMADAVRFCHWNPVRHGLVAAPEAWPFTTYRP